jgi:ATP-dependent RNA helicase RhlE
LKKSYTAVVKEGKLFLNETTDLPEGTSIQLIEVKSSHQLLISQIENDKNIVEHVEEKEFIVEQIEEKKPISPEISTIEESADGDISENSFDKFNLHKLIIPAIDMVGYTTPTLIQNQAIQSIIDKRDVLGIAKTGSGKTAAFALPILDNLLNQKSEPEKQPKVLIISPTRELAIQIGVSFNTYGRFTPLKQVTIFGGVKQKNQVDLLRDGGYPILVATPGRLLDLMNQKIISLAHVQILVLDEADRMLDMGFIPDIKRIVSRIPQRDQSLLFSATMPKEILDLAKSFLKDDFVHVTGDQQSIPINNIAQEIYFVEKGDKLALLENLLSHDNISRALIFSRTKYGVDKLVRKLKKQSYTIEAMHGNKSQTARQRALSNFKENKTQILIATDLAARGLDVDDITHVINYDLSPEPETYMHRIGRTARAGKSGIAISFCSNEERKYLVQIEQLLGFHIPRAIDNPLQSVHEEPLPTQIGKKMEVRNKGNSRAESNKRTGKKRSRRFKGTDKPKKSKKSFSKNESRSRNPNI